MKKLKIGIDAKGFPVTGYSGGGIGHIHKERVGRRKLLCLISDDLTFWRPNCLRQVADFIDSQEHSKSKSKKRKRFFIDKDAEIFRIARNGKRAVECGLLPSEIIKYFDDITKISATNCY